jgi:hypothetical protein
MSARGNIILGAVVLALIYLAFFVLPQAIVPGPASRLETGPAVELANQAKTLPPIDDQTCHGSSQLVSNIATILQDMDGTLGTGFGAVVQFDTSNCNIAIQFIPILGSYNSLVKDSKNVDPNNATSVKVFYEDAFILSSDFIIINDGISYRIAFRSTGEMNDALKLAKLREFCGDECYRVVLSGIHWAIRVYMNQFLCDFENWASQYAPDILSHPC